MHATHPRSTETVSSTSPPSPTRTHFWPGTLATQMAPSTSAQIPSGAWSSAAQTRPPDRVPSSPTSNRRAGQYASRRPRACGRRRSAPPRSAAATRRRPGERSRPAPRGRSRPAARVATTVACTRAQAARPSGRRTCPSAGSACVFLGRRPRLRCLVGTVARIGSAGTTPVNGPHRSPSVPTCYAGSA
jgi:hypothetical protein